MPVPFTSVVQMYHVGRSGQVHVSYLSENKYTVFTVKLYLVSKLCLLITNCAYS